MSFELERRKGIKSQAKKIRTLITKQKGLIKSYIKAVDFESPILILIRNNKKVEFYEKATKGEFEFRHSNGEETKILLDPSFKLQFPYINKYASGYICHEDYALPMPHDALLTTEQLSMHENKVLALASELAIKAQRAKALTIKQWVTMAAVIGGVFILWVLLKPNAPAELAQTITTTAQNFTLG